MTMDFKLELTEEEFIPLDHPESKNFKCQICSLESSKEYSDYYDHHHEQRAICLECHARAAVRQYVGKLALSEEITHSFLRYFESMKSFPAVILIHYKREVSCVECKKVYTFDFRNKIIWDELVLLVHSEVDCLRNPPVEYLVEAICDLKERIADLLEEKNFLIAENENLKNLIK